ncbi:MAG: KH domain-containing protein [Clostridia bacterium]|nr:KH domain-containing protein [Clostridia bacterium]
MVELKKVLTDIAKAIVDDPEQVTVIETVEGDNVMLERRVAEDDMGKVIGRHGKIAKSIRLVMKAAANTIGKRVTVEIR